MQPGNIGTRSLSVLTEQDTQVCTRAERPVERYSDAGQRPTSLQRPSWRTRNLHRPCHLVVSVGYLAVGRRLSFIAWVPIALKQLPGVCLMWFCRCRAPQRPAIRARRPNGGKVPHLAHSFRKPRCGVPEHRLFLPLCSDGFSGIAAVNSLRARAAKNLLVSCGLFPAEGSRFAAGPLPVGERPAPFAIVVSVVDPLSDAERIFQFDA